MIPFEEERMMKEPEGKIPTQNRKTYSLRKRVEEERKRDRFMRRGREIA